MHLVRTPDLATLLFALSLCAVFGGLFAWVLSVPFWLGFAMVGAGLFAFGLQRHDDRPAPRRRWQARASH
ncbi:hypothetical protein [Silanimonas sp.]|jgi:hypothetical protein|uniref:hypothetical protein n=1 Tax=Silanimonas sp. TaxID=1929290 RepID=UPI0022C2B2A2|nr:hypothetical protein [Silanimonas sp.]MCZ8164168.1 hypothetical protein [Silanimonas sp.]